MVLRVLSVPVIESIVAAVVSMLALIVTCVHRGMCFEDLPEIVSKVVKSIECGMKSSYRWFEQTR